MRTFVYSLPLALSLAVTQPALGETPVPNAAPSTAQAEALIAEVLKNVNWELLVKLQQTLLANIDKVMPYTEEYINCLRAEGVVEEGAPLNLERIITQSQTVARRCNVILETLAAQMDFSLSEQEIEEGLSPEYREMLKKSL